MRVPLEDVNLENNVSSAFNYAKDQIGKRSTTSLYMKVTGIWEMQLTSKAFPC